MTTIGALLEHPGAQAWAWALVHFLWQGALIGVVLWCVWRFTSLSAQSRYAIGVAGLAAMLAAPVLTVLVIRSDAPTAVVTPNQPATVSSLEVPTAVAADVVAAAPPVTPAPRQASDPIGPFILAFWLAGVIVLTSRLLGGWFVVRGVARHGVGPVAADVELAARRLRERLGLHRAVRLFESTSVVVPVTIGWLKPVVLLPMSAMSGLSNAQIEALLAHELAHVRRHDYLVNLLQSAVETVLFYHPAVWWVSKRVRAEREHCCDDLAVTLCDRVVYVRALTDLAAMTSPRLALAATDGSLMRRVTRLLGSNGDRGASGWAAVMLVAVLAAGLVPAAIAAMAERGDQSNASRLVSTADRKIESEAAERVSDAVEAPQAMPADESLAWQSEPVQAARQQEIEEIKRLLEQEAEIARRRRDSSMQIELEALRLQREKARVEAETERTLLMAQMEDVKRKYDVARKRVAAGTASPESQEELETALQMLDAKLRALSDQGRLTERMIALKEQELFQDKDIAERQAAINAERQAAVSEREARRFTLTQEYDRLQSDYERLKTLVERGLAAPSQAEDLRLRLREVERALDQLRREGELLRATRGIYDELRADVARRERDLRDMVARRALPTPADALESRRALPAGERAAAGQAVALRIQNEPDISRTYTIAADGTIRLPLLGSLKVAGLTADEIGALIRRQLTDRQLARGATVEVTLRGRN